jgi:hypothetical protein
VKRDNGPFPLCLVVTVAFPSQLPMAASTAPSAIFRIRSPSVPSAPGAALAYLPGRGAPRGPMELTGDGQRVNAFSIADVAEVESSIMYCALKAVLNNLTVTLARARPTRRSALPRPHDTRGARGGGAAEKGLFSS